MKLVRSGLVAAGLAFLGACGGATDITVANLEGTWDATAYVYTNLADSSDTVDIVIVHGATMVLVVQANGTTTSTFNDGQGNTSSDGGAFTATDMTITLAGVTYPASLDGNRLTLTSDNGQYDFNGDGSKDPATVRIALRLR